MLPSGRARPGRFGHWTLEWFGHWTLEWFGHWRPEDV